MNIPIRKVQRALSRKQESRLLKAIQEDLASSLDSTKSQERNVDNLNQLIARNFALTGIEVEYAGPYGILPGKELVSNPLFPDVAYLGSGPGCTDIDLHRGVIGTAIRNRASIYIPSVLDLEDQDPAAHHECRKPNEKRRDMSEIVIAVPKITFDGRVAIQETYDLDLRVPRAFSDEGAIEFEGIIVPAMRICFPEKVITYNPIEGLHVRPSPAYQHD